MGAIALELKDICDCFYLVSSMTPYFINGALAA